MSQTKPVRTISWRQTTKVVLAGLVFLPIVALTFVEWFVDPFPNSLWLLRILNTKYLVHVRADLTVDGEPLVMERTIRCFYHSDFKFINRHWNHHTFPADGQTGDTLAATTSKGRLFAINDLNVCRALVDRFNLHDPKYIAPDAKDTPPRRLSRHEIAVPSLFEIHGGYEATRVDEYISRDLLLAGYHGVRLDELLVERAPMPASPWDFAKDWNGYDWFGYTNWVRPFVVGHTRGYTAGYIVPVKFDVWSTTPILPKGALGGELERSQVKFRNAFLSFTEDKLIYGAPKNAEEKFLFQFLRNFVDFNHNGLILHPRDPPDLNLEQPWVKHDLIPCLGEDYGHICRAAPEMAGVLIFTRIPRKYRPPITDTKPLLWYHYFFDGKKLSIHAPLWGVYFRASDRTAFVLDLDDSYLGSD